MEKDLFDKIYNQVYEMFLVENRDLDNQYTRREWIFPNHIDLVIENSKKFALKYGADVDVCVIAALFHDSGLVYGRDKGASPKGHEQRSLDYAKNVLLSYDFKEDFIDKVLNCICATDAGFECKSLEQKVVSTADAYSQFMSVHFFAKASFFGEWDFFRGWFTKKIESNFSKLKFEDEQNEVMPIYNHYKKILNAK